MVRKNRLKNGNLYSVVTRINNWREDFADEKLCKLYLEHLKAVKYQTDFALYAFVIMPTHVHLCLEISDKQEFTISEVMQKINGGFSQKFNSIYGQRGHFWQARFKSKIIFEIEHLINTIIYFSLNPVRGGICRSPFDYNFSSIHSLNSDLFTDLVNDLPKIIKKPIIDDLISKKYLHIHKRLNIKRYSFQLTKRSSDQKFRYYS